MSEVNVRASLRVIANGRRVNSGQSYLRFTLIATPEYDPENPPTNGQWPIDLAEWPQQMAQRLRLGDGYPFGKNTVVLYARPIRAEAIPNVPPDGWAAVTLNVASPGAYANAGQWDVIGELWKSTFETRSESWAALAREIEEATSGDKQSVKLEEELKNESTIDPEGALRSKPYDHGIEATIRGVVPIRQSDLAIEEETERAVRVLSKQMNGPSAFLEDVEPEAVNYREKFDNAVEQTNPERKASKAVYDAVKNLIEKGAKPPTPMLPAGPAPLVPDAQDTAQQEKGWSSSRLDRRATHVYGTWLQRKAEEAVSPNPAAEKLRGVYFAILGDPTLARLFALNFDFVVSEEAFGKAMEAAFPKVPIEHLYLALAPAPGTGLATVATAARLHARGFWPVSAFESLVAKRANGEYEIISEPSLVQQSDGIWRLGETMGAGADASVPRYGLTSLDLRRSVDSKTRSRDLGESQLTGGFTILDRGRANQVAIELALDALRPGSLKQPSSLLVLYAEDLTVGRHVDVAVAKGGAALKDLEWRSLMHRTVNFDFAAADAVAESVLKKLVPMIAGKGALEEISFQVISRLMPTSSTAAEYEAITEEAIFLWDGTPAAVLTDPLLNDPTQGGKQPESLLPFRRELDLPASEAAGASLRPPPLRFGYPYLFRLRSMFLGGGAPGAADPDTRDNTDDNEILPAGASKKARPRRFLRHESISAPTLALPNHLAERQLRRMGFELVDQAIVRSWNDTPSNLAILSVSDLINGAYVERRDRELPQTTQRVVLPPEAAFDLVVRHGKLDNVADTAAIRRGGLLDVAYTPKRPPKVVPKVERGGEPRVTPSGFPVAITTTRDALDPEGVAYRRRVALSPGDGDRGVPVFVPGGTNSTAKGENGFLPDPAIDSYSIRARIRGSACYLEKDLAVPLYAGRSFPDALPLIVVVSKLGVTATDLRPAPPTTIGDIAQYAGVWRMKADGTLRPDKPGSGTRVQRVNVGLYPGEDFDLEIACLPNPEVLRDTFAVIETMALQANAAAADALLRNRIAAICTEAVGAACKASGKTQPLSGIDGAALPDMATLRSVAEQLLDAMKNKWPVEEIAAVTTLRACHAVTKPAPVRWKDPKAVKAFRRKDEYACNEILEPPKADQEEAHDLLLDGQVAIDLSLVGSFQVLAETVGTEGLKLDDANRGRSMISKRSGRWPTLIQKDGVRAYVSPDDVLGFKVAEDGSVTLPCGTITLLSVSNLPNHGAIGELIWPVDDGHGVCVIPSAKQLRDEVKAGTPPGSPVFAGTEGRLTLMELAPLFAAAATVQIAQRIAMPDGARDVVNETRTLKSERPQRFRDTLARRLILSIVSVSRHAAAFETAPTYFPDARQMLFRRQPLRRSDQSILDTQTVEVWARSTARPAAPDIRRPEPSFLFSRSAEVSPVGLPVHKVTRRTMTRLYFGRGWFSSGEGERVAVILWPPDYRQLTGAKVDRDQIAFGGRTMKLDDFQDRDLGAGGQFVTRWGGDPIRGDANPQSGFLIPPTAFGEFEKLGKGPHRPGFVPSARLPIPKTSQPKKDEADEAEAQRDYEFLTVSLITFEPCFDIDREEWYVDVELRPIRASEPFVRFGVARYQEQSINDELMLSEPVSVTMQLLPLRDAAVAETPPGKTDERSFEVTVRGFGQTDVKDLKPMQLKDARERQADWAENFDKLRTPKVKLAVFHEAGRGGDLRRTPISLSGLKKVDDSGLAELSEAERENSELVWTTSFSLPNTLLEALGPGRLVAYLEEVDRRMPASYRVEPVDFATMFSPDTFRDSGPRFSARIPFTEIGEAGPPE